MILREVKNSMLFKACKYNKQKMSMEKFISVNDGSMIQPEKDIIRFYLGAHVMGVVESKFGIDNELPQEVEELVKIHHANMEEVFFRIFTYILLISVGESRHGKISSKTATIQSKYGGDVKNFGQVTNGKKNRSGSRQEFLSCDRDLLDLSRYCDWMFDNCFAGMGSYGGKKWKNISQKITQVLEGEISHFTMVDIAWALVHNTGSIFNKNTIYHHEQNSYGLTQLLDMQRGGAIPAMIKHHGEYKTNCPNFSVTTDFNAEFSAYVDAATEVLGESFAAYVSPSTINEAGALSKATFKKDVTEKKSTASEDDTFNDDFYSHGILDFGVVKIPTLKRTGK